MLKTVGQRVLERAAQKLGEPQLAALLQISQTNLKAFLDGYKPVPDAVLLRAVDVVLDQLPEINRQVSQADLDPKRP